MSGASSIINVQHLPMSLALPSDFGDDIVMTLPLDPVRDSHHFAPAEAMEDVVILLLANVTS